MANPAGGRGTERVNVSKAGVRVGSRPALNLLEGANVTITVSDNASDDILDVTLASSGGAGVTDHALLTNVTATQHHSNANDHANTLDHAQAHGNADHTTTGTPGNSAVGDTAAQGASASVARLDHAHGRESFVTPAIVHGTTAATGAATTPIRSDATLVTFDATVPVTQAFADAAATGSVALAARRDHKHGMPSNPVTFATPSVVLGSAAAAGASGSVIRADATVAAFDATAPTTSAVGDSAAVGTIAFAARRDHAHGREAFAANALILGTAAAAGVATTLMRRDDTIAAFDATVPTTSAVAAAAATGSIAFAARRDHVHGREAFATPGVTTPLALSAAGAATTIPRSDHAHQSPGAIAAITSEVSLSSSVTETSIVTATLPTSFLFAGTTFRITLRGTVQVQATSGILTFRVYIGANASAETYVMATQVSAAGPVGFFLDTTATVRSTGASGTYVSHGWGQINFTSAAILTTTTATTATVDTTAATPVVKATAQWATSSATNILKVETATIEVVKM